MRSGKFGNLLDENYFLVGRLTERYAHLHDDPVNQAVDKIDQQLESLIKVG
jgi:hypothetical protein